jgi:multidrug efflux system membrane fusion protein
VPVSVSVETAASREVPLEVTVIGSVVPISVIEVRSRIEGQIERVFFKEGQEVKKGDPLFQIDARPYRVALERAAAELARDEVALRSAEVEEKRYGALQQQKLVSPQEYDVRAVALATARATLVADRSAVDSARVNLEYTKITASISGRTGSLQTTQGNVVKANSDKPLVVIRQISPIYVAFAVPADRLPEIRRFSQKGALAVEAGLHSDTGGGGGENVARGELTFIDNTIDAATGTIALKATFANEDHELWPGQFVDASLRLSALPNATVIPARAVQPSQQGNQVFVIGADLVAQARVVKLGPRIGDAIVIEQGVAPGERVVVDGQLNLLPGSKVVVKGGADEPSQPKPEEQKPDEPKPEEQKSAEQTRAEGRRP